MKMKRLAFLKRLTFAILALFLTANLWGQKAWSGSGTSSDPYQISSTSDWNAFADTVTRGLKNYSGKFFILTQDITINVYNYVDTLVEPDKIAGAWSSDSDYNPFSGTFDGNWHTITFNVGLKKGAYIPGQISDDKPFPSAPFRVIDGATINNLHVAGKIKSTRKYNSGLVGFAYSTKTAENNYINNCTSDIFIDCSAIKNGDSDCSAAGFLAENKSNGKTVFENCVFSGTIDKGTLSSGDRCGGFVSYHNGKSLAFTNCTMNGTITLTGTRKANFYRNSSATLTEAYCTKNNYGDQGTQANTSEPADKFVKKYVYDDGATTYYVPGAVITGLATTYSYIEGSPVELAPVVKYYGKTLTRGTDYIIKIDGTEVPTGDTPTLSAAGDYTFTIEGIGNYGGSTETDITVLNINSWSTLKDALLCDSGVFTLNGDIIADTTKETDTTLWVKTGNITLNLNGHTINRGLTRIVSSIVEGTPDKNGPGQVIRIKNGASLTINGPGTITGGFHKGAEGNIDGGGIYNMGNLTLNNVNVIGNKCIKQDGENFSGRGGGIYSGNTASLIITGGEITDNEAIGGGGGIYCYMSNPFNMTGVMIISNTSEDKGGGIRVVVSNGNTVNLINCNIIRNCATVNTESKGGGIYYEGSSNNSILNLVNDNISANTSFILGGAIYSHRGTITATNCVMDNNVSFDDDGFWASDESYGGAVCLYAGGSTSYSTFIMDGGSITGDVSKTNGGGIYVYTHSKLQVKGNVIITNNTQMGNDLESSNNNVYLAGAASGDKIQVVGELGPDAVIGLANSDPGTYIAVADGVSLDHILEHIALDNNENRMIINGSGEVEVYVPYSWDNTGTWNGTIATNLSGNLPDDESHVTVYRAIRIPSDCVAEAAEITLNGSGEIIIGDGGQLITSNTVAVTSQKNVVAANAAESTGWYLLSSPVTNPNITSATNLITPVSDARYDLYRFNEAVELQWENYKAHSSTDFTTLENGRGYLYRNEHNHTVEIKGTLNVSDVTYDLSCSGYGDLKGFNLIGNPYSHNITKGNSSANILNGDIFEEKYYVLEGREVNEEVVWDWYLNNDGTAIPPVTGILVQAKQAGSVTMTYAPSTASAKGEKEGKNNNLWFTVANSNYMDEVCVEFKEGRGLNKIEHMNEDAPMLYIRHNGEDFASVDMNPDIKAFDLNFEAKTSGFYTLKVKPQGDFGYMHLIDKVADKDIDLLQVDGYEFIGSPVDRKDRFKMVLNPLIGEDSDDVFAYQDGSDIMVSGEGELQIFDVTGRFVMSRNVNGYECIGTSMLKTGVYILRIVGDQVKTQKIVVR